MKAELGERTQWYRLSRGEQGNGTQYVIEGLGVGGVGDQYLLLAVQEPLAEETGLL